MKIAIIIGSTRAGRVGPKLAAWVDTIISERHDTKILDLAEYKLPFYDSELPPSKLGGKYDHDSVQKWAHDIKTHDAFIFIAPEYNHGIAAPLKNAIDWLWEEWAGKPATIVSYSNGLGGGLRGAEQLKLVLSAVGIRLSQFHPSVGRVDPDIPEDANAPVARQLQNIVQSF